MEVWNTIVNAFRDENFGTWLQAAAIFVVGLVIIKILLTVTRHVLNKSTIDSVLYTFIINCVKILCMVILIITVLGYLGVPTSTFVTVVAAAGAAIALAVKDTLGNFAGGLLIILNKPFSKGDLIECNGVTGKVQQIDLMFSTLQTFDNKIITIPNAILANNTLINYSGMDRRRIDIKIGVSYDSDIDHVKTVIKSVLDSSDYFYKDPEPIIGVADYSDSSIDVDVMVWCDTSLYYDAKYYLLENLKKSFDREGIDIPYPQVVVHTAPGGAD
ncbi:MAG: mechanosensitive ion channel family protein [Anaerovoracaceae bacterium]